MARFIVVGSGPAGVSVSYALLKQGHDVTMVDYGNYFSSKTLNNVARLRDARQDKQLRQLIKFPIDSNVPLKVMYNDDFVYRDNDRLNIMQEGFDYRTSLAMGGLSNIWGTCSVPYSTDIDDWPISYFDLEPYYRKVHDFMPLNAEIDDLQSVYPILTDNFLPPKTSSQGVQLLAKLEKRKELLKSRGMIFGKARTAYYANKCNPCSLCLYGCPDDLIYSSRQDLPKLMEYDNFKYAGGYLVTDFLEANGKIQLNCLDKNNVAHQFGGDKLILAAGTLSTTSIVLKSLNYTDPVKLQDNPYFLFPLIDFSLKGDLRKEITNTLPQVAIQLRDEKISSKAVHLQIYGYNDVPLRLLEKKYGLLYKLAAPLIKSIFNKTHIVQGFFHSQHSAEITMQYENDKFNIRSSPHLVDALVKQVMYKFKGIGYTPTYELAIPGRSYHVGGSLPMQKSPEGLATDIYGRLNGFQHVHAVDTSIFPSILAQTVTYTIMANAYRIGASF